LENIVKSLVKNGILIGLRGKGGGYRLSKTPDQISVGDILRMTEGSLSPVACLEDGASPCARMAICKTLPMWQGLDKLIRDYLDNYTIADLMQVGQPGNDYVI
jgi:Rrf2 family protein